MTWHKQQSSRAMEMMKQILQMACCALVIACSGCAQGPVTPLSIPQPGSVHKTIDMKTPITTLIRAYAREPEGWGGINWGRETNVPVEKSHYYTSKAGVVAIATNGWFDNQYLFFDGAFIGHLWVMSSNRTAGVLDTLYKKHGWAHHVVDGSFQCWAWIGKKSAIVLILSGKDGRLMEFVLDSSHLARIDFCSGPQDYVSRQQREVKDQSADTPIGILLNCR